MIDYQEVVKYFENKLNTGVNRNRRKYYKTAISAMQELQMYKDEKLCLVPEDVYTRQCEELDEYKQLGTLEEVREAMEKQDPKKVEIWNGQAMCPNCRSLFGDMSDIRKLIA